MYPVFIYPPPSPLVALRMHIVSEEEPAPNPLQHLPHQRCCRHGPCGPGSSGGQQGRARHCPRHQREERDRSAQHTGHAELVKLVDSLLAVLAVGGVLAVAVQHLLPAHEGGHGGRVGFSAGRHITAVVPQPPAPCHHAAVRRCRHVVLLGPVVALAEQLPLRHMQHVGVAVQHAVAHQCVLNGRETLRQAQNQLDGQRHLAILPAHECG
mmetsp:Transcript_16483/g.35631  ORF Transcript_16483/g.35631 Transcript_16483/m.35631 type:complete len:210 (-) Transcript_16483:1178-1807(-)